MTKAELISQLAEKTDLKKAQVDAVLEAQAAIFQQQLQASGELTLPGVGKFNVKTRAARHGRNPQTGAAIEIPAKKVVTFLAVQDVRVAVNTTA